MKRYVNLTVIGGFLTILSVTAQADVKSDVINKIPLQQIVKQALARQEKSSEIAVQLVNACVKPVAVTKAVVEETSDQAVPVVVAVIKSYRANMTCRQHDKTTADVPSAAVVDSSKAIAELVSAIVDLVVNSGSRRPVNDVIEILNPLIVQLILATGEGVSPRGDFHSIVLVPTVGAGSGHTAGPQR